MDRQTMSALTERALSRSEVEQVLARAVEIEMTRDQIIEMTRDHITESQLVEIAREAGIDTQAIRAALMEQRAGPLPNEVSMDGSLSALVASGVAFTALGAASRAIRPFIQGGVHWDTLGALAVTVAVLTMLAWRPSRARRQQTFQAYNVVIWAGSALGFSLVHGSLWDDLALVTVIGAACSALVGGVVVALRKPPTSGARHGVAEIWGRTVHRVSKFVRGKLASGESVSRRADLVPAYPGE